ncbi:hypothetical protein DYB35_010222 [Aphanomyces astaci]|uniref:Uncharacterized protein n=1 Tax=Aphanomyces astaci TaxID=112090 RepID=A0A3R7BE74_APHAT|nr:hypothetical protein DYB35_010222 [Aphanomyces astaci]
MFYALFYFDPWLPIQWPVKANGEPLTADEQCQVCCFVMDILLDYYQLATKVIPIEGSLYVRISAQIYNERADFERLGVAIQGLTNCSSFIEMFSTMRQLSIDMCIILDECVLLIVLSLQALTILPAIAVTREVGLAVLSLYLITALFSVTYAFLYTLRECCPCINALQRHGSKFFYVLHIGLIATTVATISILLEPFLSGVDFSEYCLTNALDHNLSSTGCLKLQGYTVVALMTLTLEVGLSVYMLVLGRRISKKHAVEYARLVREKSLSDAELPSVVRGNNSFQKKTGKATHGTTAEVI